ncbi:hypothetical protein VP1G_11182 [Cytospora mali]|uniref:Uncharacterized protein n=1 Tax=Cytospora mali TaxID=578113 RepID=A0A194V7F1_CYTMA|nr:hypothetical protein VP1G_11182 [Valsa mali var. pyri (nom. inval.)]
MTSPSRPRWSAWVPTGADKQEFMNIGEMFLALTFTSLQAEHLRYWLPNNASLPAEPIGLNVTLRLWPGRGDKAGRATSPLARLGGFDGSARLTTQVSASLAVAVAGFFEDHFRNPDISLGDLARVEVSCAGMALRPCGALTIDDVPFYRRRSGMYIVRRLRCSSCEMRPTDSSSRRKMVRCSHFPAGANKGLPFITYGAAEWRLKTKGAI